MYLSFEKRLERKILENSKRNENIVAKIEYFWFFCKITKKCILTFNGKCCKMYKQVIRMYYNVMRQRAREEYVIKLTFRFSALIVPDDMVLDQENEQ